MQLELDQLPDSPINALNKCDSRFFSKISTLLRLLCTVPVTSCDAEINALALCQIRPFLRTTMTEDRPSGLALFHIHQNISIDLDDAVPSICLQISTKITTLNFLSLVFFRGQNVLNMHPCNHAYIYI